MTFRALYARQEVYSRIVPGGREPYPASEVRERLPRGDSTGWRAPIAARHANIDRRTSAVLVECPGGLRPFDQWPDGGPRSGFSRAWIHGAGCLPSTHGGRLTT
jgi:hypothetical protein